MRVLLVGVGYVASRLVPLLLENGHTVYGLRRSARELPPGTIPLLGDVTSSAGLTAIPEGIDVAVFAVAPGERSDEAYERTYFHGIKNVVAALPGCRILFVSSTAVYGDSAGLVSEETPALAESGTARWLRQAEQIAEDSHPDSVVLRASGIYGPGRTSSIARWLAAPPTPPERSELTNRIHRDDLARCLAFFIERPALGGLYLATDRYPASVGEIYDWLREVTVPEALLLPGKSARVREARRHRALSSEKLQSTGFQFEFPSFREGYSSIFRALRNAETVTKP